MKEIKLSNKVIITDPCYGIQDYPNPHTKLVLDNVKEGIYKVNVLYSDEGVWGKRVAALEVINKQNDLSGTNLHMIDRLELVGSVCVDSGQMSISDYNYYKTLCNAVGEIDDSWYDVFCALTLSADQFGVIDNSSVVSRTGYGDGDYAVVIGYWNKEIVYISVRFIVEDEEEDDELEDCNNEE